MLPTLCRSMIVSIGPFDEGDTLGPAAALATAELGNNGPKRSLPAYLGRHQPKGIEDCSCIAGALNTEPPGREFGYPRVPWGGVREVAEAIGREGIAGLGGVAGHDVTIAPRSRNAKGPAPRSETGPNYMYGSGSPVVGCAALTSPRSRDRLSLTRPCRALASPLATGR